MRRRVAVLGVTELTARCLEILATRDDCIVETLVVPDNATTRWGVSPLLLDTAADLEVPVISESDLMSLEGTRELGFAIGYPTLLGPEVISCFTRNIVNLHLAPLPRYRGSLKTLSMAMLRRERHFGVTLHQIDAGIDTGPVLRKRTFPLPDHTDVSDMVPLLVDEARALFETSLDELLQDTLEPIAQGEIDGGVSELVCRADLDHLLDIRVPITVDELALRRRALTWSSADRPRLIGADGIEIDWRSLRGRFQRRMGPDAAEPLSASVVGESGAYFEPVWRVNLAFTPLEQELLLHQSVRRLAYVAHAGAASILSPQSYSRLDHSLGLLALVSELRPDDQVMRAAALLHDVGHLPLSHTLEPILGVDHHENGAAVVRRMGPLLDRHGIRVEEVLESMRGEGPSALGSGDVMSLDHFESYVRSAFVHGTTREDPLDTLRHIDLVGGAVSCDSETAEYLRVLVRQELQRQSHPHNARANAIAGMLVTVALEESASEGSPDFGQMIDLDLWAWLGSTPATSLATRDLLVSPEHWSIHAGEESEGFDRGLIHKISTRYVNPPLLAGGPRAWQVDEFLAHSSHPCEFVVQGPLITQERARAMNSRPTVFGLREEAR